MREGLIIKPKFLRLKQLLGISTAQVVGHLELIWHVGHMRASEFIGDALDVEAAAHWGGKNGELAEALVDSGWIDWDEGQAGYIIHDYWDHAPKRIKNRLTKRIQRLRKGTYAELTKRDGEECAICGVTETRLEVAHVIPSCQGGSDDMDNLRLECRRCNASKTGRTDEEWAASRGGQDG